MKILMLSVHDDGKIALNPGDLVDFADDVEAKRIVSVGGAREPNEEELKAPAIKYAPSADAPAGKPAPVGDKK